MELGKYKHDLNSFIFKMEASAQLLQEPEGLSSDDIKLISDIILNNTRMIKLFFDCFTLFEKIEKGEYVPKKKNVTVDEITINGDPKIVEYVINIIKVVNKNPAIVVEPFKNKVIFQGKFKPENQIEKFFIEFLEKSLLFNGLQVSISEDEIVLVW
ncbi:hypothetical protein [Persephonella sp.]